MNLWLIPASDVASRANIPKTLSAPISSERARNASIDPGGRAWGARATSEMNVGKFKRMAPGDWCLFYTQGLNGGNKKYHWSGQISKTTQSKEIAAVLWDDPEFELVYFLENVCEVDITTAQLSARFSEFRRDYFKEAPKGFTAVDPDLVAGIVEKYGTVDAWLAKLHTTLRFWVEKTLVKNRPDRQTGDNALGKVLWSPQRAEDGKDIYRQMREVKPGDVIFHFVDNEALTSFSIAEEPVDDSFVGVEETAWAARPAYRILRWSRKSDHSVAKLSYGGGMRRIDRRSWILDQGWSGERLELGLPERKAQHATERSGVECGAWSGGSPNSPRRGVGCLGLSCGFRGCA